MSKRKSLCSYRSRFASSELQNRLSEAMNEERRVAQQVDGASLGPAYFGSRVQIAESEMKKEGDK